MLLASIKGKFSRQGRRGRGVDTRGICELQNQRVISKPLNTSAINGHSPGGAGPATASPSVRKQWEDRTTPAKDNWEWEFTWQSTRGGNHSNKTKFSMETSCESCHIRARIQFSHSPPTHRSCPICPQQRRAGHTQHVPDASQQSSLMRETSLQHHRGEGTKSKA